MRLDTEGFEYIAHKVAVDIYRQRQGFEVDRFHVRRLELVEDLLQGVEAGGRVSFRRPGERPAFNQRSTNLFLTARLAWRRLGSPPTDREDFDTRIEELKSSVSEAKTTGILDPERAERTEEFFRQFAYVGILNNTRRWHCE